MSASNDEIEKEVRILRAQGLTYREICDKLKIDIPKSTLSYWCKDISLPDHYYLKIQQLNIDHMKNARVKAIQVNKRIRSNYLNNLKAINISISSQIRDLPTTKIALSMLCLGEATKYPNPFCFGNSNYKIILLFLKLLEKGYDFDKRKIRCTVQCRADQNVADLENYWARVTNISKDQFYKTQIDKRSVGKPTLKIDYYGVLRINYLDTRVQLEIESLAELLYNQCITGL